VYNNLGGYEMRFRLLPEARRYLDRLDKETVKQIYEVLRDITKNPPVGELKKLEGYNSLYRLVFGNLRIILEKKGDYMLVEKIAPRGQAYKGGL
jgi:mRNA-degrading endonuclease RelE of RelBE toxin-antitoxin system